MNRDSIELLLEYNKWANSRVLQFAGPLSGEQFLKNERGGSVRDKLAHILFWEEIWLMRWKGNSPSSLPEVSEAPDLAAIRKRWEEHLFDVRNFFSKVSDAELQEAIAYENFEGTEWAYPLWQMMHHTVNHSTHHRGQIILMLRQLGAEIQPVDFLVFVDEAGAKMQKSAKTENPWA